MAVMKIYTEPTIEPVSLTDLKSHLRLDAENFSDEFYSPSTHDDDLLDSLITAARQEVEHITRRALLTQTWDYSISRWPSGDSIKLPFGNLQSITSIKWKDTDGTETTLTATTDYLVEANGIWPGRVVLPYAETWPSGSLYPSNPITIRFVCGWTTAALVPAAIRTACKMMVADLYENREAQIIFPTFRPYAANPTVASLLASYRIRDEF